MQTEISEAGLVHLDHPFVNQIPDIDELFLSDNVSSGGPGHINSINAFCNRINTLAPKYIDKMKENDFKGWAFEAFGEFLMKTMGTDNRIGIWDYQRNADLDVGVDGFGLGINTRPATVQFKFRSGDYILTANDDDLSNFVASSWNDFNVDIHDTNNMLIVTTGLEVHAESMSKMLKNKVRVLHREHLRTLCDNADMFWFRFWQSMKQSRKIAVVKVQKTPRPHQLEALEAYKADANKKGKIVLPTGVGKTLIEAMIVKYEIEAVLADRFVPLIKVNASRILLCFQLFKEISDYLLSHNINARMVNFNSGHKDETDYVAALREVDMEYRQSLSTTNPYEVMDIYTECKRSGVPLIVISTYHSSEKLGLDGFLPDLTICDEAHNLVSDGFIGAARMPTKAIVFCTATEKYTESDQDIGMNNSEIFDEMIYTRSAKQMIDAGEMLPPFIHVVKAAEGQVIEIDKLDTDYRALFASISSAFLAHEMVVKSYSASPDTIGAKMLVVCRGQQDMIQMHECGLFDSFRKLNPSIHLYALSSEFGLYADGEMYNVPVDNVKKFKLVQALQKLGSNERAIIFHVDMIGEGIDVPGITGVMPFRNCEESKFVQNIGRAARLTSVDRKKFYSGEIPSIGQLLSDHPDFGEKVYVKPCCWVIIPTFFQDSEGFKDRFENIINSMRREYGWTPRQVVLNDNVRGLSEDEPMDMVNDKTKSRPHGMSGLAGFEHTLENLSDAERILLDERIRDFMILEEERLFNDGFLEDLEV
jgi:superfamily II DNA or RNA helicase